MKTRHFENTINKQLYYYIFHVFTEKKNNYRNIIFKTKISTETVQIFGSQLAVYSWIEKWFGNRVYRDPSNFERYVIGALRNKRYVMGALRNKLRNGCVT